MALDPDGWWIDECHEPDGTCTRGVYKILKASLRGVVAS